MKPRYKPRVKSEASASVRFSNSELSGEGRILDITAGAIFTTLDISA